MAHFVSLPSRTRISSQPVSVPLRGRLEIGLWGFEESPGQELRVSSVAESVVQVEVAGLVSGHPIKMYRVVGSTLGNTRLEARNSRGDVWDFINVSVEASPLSRLVDAMNTRSLVFNHAQDRQVLLDVAAGVPHQGYAVCLAPELQNLLLGLIGGGTLTILSLYRRGQGPHGTSNPDHSFVCRAVDIAGFGELRVTLGNRDNAIRVITNLIRHFPAGTYDLGFPRPVGGPTGFDPAQDVFFPVPDEATAALCFAGRAGMPLARMLEPAQAAVRAAMAANTHARFPILYPDGLNHLHVKAY